MKRITDLDLIAVLALRYPKTYRKLVARLKAKKVLYDKA